LARALKVGRDEFKNEPDIDAVQAAYALLTTDRQRAIEMLVPLAERGSVASMVHLGWAHCLERPDYKNEEYWYLRAHNAGSREASFKLGRLYYVFKDYEKAALFFKEGIKFDDPSSMFQLGSIYLFIFNDPGEGKRLLSLAKERGHLGAELMLAQAHLQGKFGAAARMPAIWAVARAMWKLALHKYNNPDFVLE